MPHIHDARSPGDPPPPPAGGSADGYDAFISYRSTASVQAKRLRDALVALAKTHSKDRPFRVFLDTSSLLVGDLSDNITRALERSHALVVVLAKDTVESHWVDEEIRYWLSHGGDPSRLYLVRVDDVDLSWNEGTGTFAHPQALPAPLATAFDVEQKYVDLATLGKGIERAAMVPVFAAIRGIAADELRLDEAAAQRRARRRTAVIAAVMALLLVAALAAGWWALQNRNEALDALRVSQSRQLAALAQQHSDRDIGLAGVLALGSYQLDQNAETQTALMQAALDGSTLARIDSFASEVRVIAAGTADDVVVAGLDDGDLVRADSEGATVLASLGSAVTAAAATADGGTVLAAAEGSIVVIAGEEATPVTVPDGWDLTDDVITLLISPDGARGWVGSYSYGDSVSALCELDPATAECELLPSHVTDGIGYGPMQMMIDDAGILTLFDVSYGNVARIDPGTLTRLAESHLGFGTYQAIPAWSPDGGWLGVGSHDTASGVWLFSSDIEGEEQVRTVETGITQMTRSYAIAPSGREIAIGYVGGVSVIRQSEWDDTWQAPIRLDGAEDLTSLRYQRDGRGLVGVRGQRVLFWDLTQASRASTEVFSLPDLDTCAACGASELLISPDEARVAVAGSTGNDAIVLDPATGEVIVAAEGWLDFRYTLPVWVGDAQLALPLTPPMGGTEVTVPEQPEGIVSWPVQAIASYPVMAITAADGRVHAFEADGVLRTYDALDGSVLDELGIAMAAEHHPVWARFSSDGSQLALVTQDGVDPARAQVIVVGMEDGTPEPLASGEYERLVWQGDALLLQQADGRIEVWSGPSWTLLSSFAASTASLVAADSSGRSALAALSRLDNSIDLLDTASGQIVTTFSSRSGNLYDRSAVAFMPVTGRLAIFTEGGGNNELTMYDLSAESLVGAACKVAWTALVPDGWSEFAPGADAPEGLCTRTE